MTRPVLQDDGFEAAVLGRIKLGRLGTVEDLVGAALFLASNAFSLVVDGGWAAE